ncbi:MAG: SPFH domain-containing protein, partial [Lachnospiraceae bacterium]|nr:SPFH domain-containing protein [Lachnospiraceae bacterium]
LREVLVEKWTNNRGITLHTFNINSINADPQDEEMIRQAQRNAIYRDPTMAAATLVGAQSQAMQDAAKNSAGAMTGFMGMGMAAQAGGVNAQNLFAMGQQQQAAAPAPAAPAAGSWTCQCGTVNTGKFCSNCGTPAPAPAGNWTCKCGTVNTGKFCSNCGSPRA